MKRLSALLLLTTAVLTARAGDGNQPWLSTPGKFLGRTFGEKIPEEKRIYFQNGYHFIYFSPGPRYRGKYTKYHLLIDEKTRTAFGVECHTTLVGKDAVEKEIAETFDDLMTMFPKASRKKDRILVGYDDDGAGWDLYGYWEITMTAELDPKHPDFDDPIIPDRDKGYILFLRAIDDHLVTKEPPPEEEPKKQKKRNKKSGN